MKKFTGLVVMLCLTALAFGQTEIKIEDAAKHEGDSVKICSRIYGGRYFESSKNSPTLLNAGARYPNNPLTIVIFGEYRAAFRNKPEEYYVDKDICVTGRIVIYKGKPEIIITSEDQIRLKE